MNLGFDIYAMVNPKSEQDVLNLLDEALSELGNIHRILDDVYARCEKYKG